ncbi:unnamed protein product [Amaranthus hypochondriacus]
MRTYLLFESSSGYGLFDSEGVDEIGQNTEAVRNSITDLERFGKAVKLAAFQPFESALDALKQCNAVSEDTATQPESESAFALAFAIASTVIVEIPC